MRVCVLMPFLDAFKGANHLPLFAALHDIEWTIVTNSMKPANAVLPKNVSVTELHAKLGPYYYGFADHLFAKAVLKKYPVTSDFWNQFDVIHLNQTMGLSFLELQQTGVPIVYMVHHPVTADRDIAVMESSGLASMLWRLKYWFLVRSQRQLCRTLPHLATVSHTVAKRLIEDYGCSESKIMVIANGIDLEVFRPALENETEFDVVALGSFIHPRKGFPYLLQAYKKLLAKGYRIADVGRRSDEQRRMLKELPGITVFGTVPEPELLRVMQHSSALISSSLYEGFGLSLIEALACGRPAFAFDAGAVKEVLAPIDPALVSPAKDVEALADNISRFLSLPPEERRHRGQKYRSEVEKHYSLQHSAERLRSLYTSLKSKNA